MQAKRYIHIIYNIQLVLRDSASLRCLSAATTGLSANFVVPCANFRSGILFTLLSWRWCRCVARVVADVDAGRINWLRLLSRTHTPTLVHTAETRLSVRANIGIGWRWRLRVCRGAGGALRRLLRRGVGAAASVAGAGVLMHARMARVATGVTMHGGHVAVDAVEEGALLWAARDERVERACVLSLRMRCMHARHLQTLSTARVTVKKHSSTCQELYAGARS